MLSAFPCLFGHLTSSFERYLFRSCAHLKTGLVLLWVELCELLVYLRSSSLSDVWFAHIFSRCTHCLSWDCFLCCVGFIYRTPPWSGSVFAACAFGVVSKEALSTPCHDAPPVSSSCSFMVPGPVSLLHFEMISLIVGAEGPASPSCLLSSGSSSTVY